MPFIRGTLAIILGYAALTAAGYALLWICDGPWRAL